MIFYWTKKLTAIIIAIALVSVGVNMFLAPHDIAAGGLTGLAIILEHATGMDRAIIVLIGNALVVISTFFFLGKEVFFKTAIGAMLLPLFMFLIPNDIVPINDRMLSVIVGSAIFGVAVSILYHFNASSGGTAVPPLIFKKYFGLNTSIGLFVSDGTVILLSLIVFTVESFFFAIFSIFVTMFVMHYLETGINRKKMVHIISDKMDDIKHDILHEVGRGATVIPAVGAYNGNAVNMLMVTCTTSDYRKLLALVDKHDKKAFMVTNSVKDVHGEGFTYEPGTV